MGYHNLIANFVRHLVPFDNVGWENRFRKMECLVFLYI